MASGFKDYVFEKQAPSTASLLLGSAKSFTVDCSGMNGLQLNCDYTRSAGTALAFTFTVQEPNDNGNYAVKKVDISAGTVSTFTLTYTTSVTEKFSFSVPITGKNIIVTVTGTATTNSDILVVYPHPLILS